MNYYRRRTTGTKMKGQVFTPEPLANIMVSLPSIVGDAFGLDDDERGIAASFAERSGDPPVRLPFRRGETAAEGGARKGRPW